MDRCYDLAFQEKLSQVYSEEVDCDIQRDVGIKVRFIIRLSLKTQNHDAIAVNMNFGRKNTIDRNFRCEKINMLMD